MKEENRRRERAIESPFTAKSALILSICISVIFAFIMLITYLYARAKDIGGGIRFSDIFTMRMLATSFSNVLILYFLFRFQFGVLKKHKENGKRRLLLFVLGSFFIVFALSAMLARIQWTLLGENLPINYFLVIHFVKDTVILVITFLFTALLVAWTKQQKAELDIRQLSIENLQNRYNALKNQLDPHFLFNTLNTLNGLIGYDDDKAHEYLDQLSEVFRHTMQNKQIVNLDNELEFVEAYSYLMKIRYNESLQITYNINEQYGSYSILPFGIQSLIENAVKHNVITNKHPLTITVETTDRETLTVRNNVCPKTSGTDAVGVGLANLNERYQLMFNRTIEITQNENYFQVEIPLIKENTINKSEYENINHRRRICCGSESATPDHAS